MLTALVLAPYGAEAQNKIDNSKKELTEKEGVNYNGNSSVSTSSSGDSGSSFAQSVAGGIFMYTLGAVFKYGIIGDYRHEDHLYNDLTDYPFLEAEAGNFYNPKFDEASINNFRIDIKDKFIYSNNDLFGNHLEVKVRPFQYFYFKTDYYQLYEFQEAAGTSSQLSLFYFNFAYDRIRLERFNLGWTLGASYVAGEVDKGGFAFGINTEFFLKKNISFMGGAKWSFINSRPVHVYELESRFHKKSYFLSLGYERLKIATPVYNYITIGGGIYIL